MLLPRFLTALVGAPVLLAAIWFGAIPFSILIFGIIMLSLYEYYTLAEESAWPASKMTGLLCGALLTLSMALFGTQSGWALSPQIEAYFSPAMLSLILLTLVLSVLLRSDKENAFLDIAVTFLGIFYIAWTLAHLLLIRDLRPDGVRYSFFLFFVVWALDIGAYLGGRKFGKHPLSETVSPKKTWEGVLSGSVAALVTAILCRQTFLGSIRIQHAMGLGILIAVLAQFSDLSESLFKRNVSAKDSGTLLPGHGGILDRFDSFLLTAPVYYYVLVFCLK